MLEIIFGVRLVEDVNKFLATGKTSAFPKTCQVRSNENGSVHELALTDVGCILELKNPVPLTLLQT